jgi:hypothetical protein
MKLKSFLKKRGPHAHAAAFAQKCPCLGFGFLYHTRGGSAGYSGDYWAELLIADC